MKLRHFGRLTAGIALALAAAMPGQALADTLETAFDSTFGTQLREPQDFTAQYQSPLAQQIALLADGSRGRIGVAAIDLTTGEQISVLGNQRFPLASTSKIAIAAAYLEGVDQGRRSLDDKYPLMLSPTRQGQVLTARELIELAITRSSNEAADGLLRAVGGPRAVNDWVRRAGITEFSIDRDIATLVRDDGAVDPAQTVDVRDSATPLAMVALVKGLHEGRWLTSSSRDVLLGAMSRCKTGPQRIPGQMPTGVLVAHKTGSLYNTSSDVGIVTGPDGHAIALAIYVTGGNNDHRYRFEKIATIARAIYDGYGGPARQYANARYQAAGSADATVAAN